MRCITGHHFEDYKFHATVIERQPHRFGYRYRIKKVTRATCEHKGCGKKDYKRFTMLSGIPRSEVETAVDFLVDVGRSSQSVRDIREIVVGELRADMRELEDKVDREMSQEYEYDPSEEYDKIHKLEQDIRELE